MTDDMGSQLETRWVRVAIRLAAIVFSGILVRAGYSDSIASQRFRLLSQPSEDLELFEENSADNLMDSVGSTCRTGSVRSHLEQLSFLAAIDGAKQPQDFGVNADLGMRFRAQYAAPLVEECGIGFQIGTAVTWTDNAVRVFELLGEDSTRLQNYTTAGLFQRVGRVAWGGVVDYMYQDGFDTSSLGQFRGRVSYNVTSNTQLGLTGRFRLFDDSAEFLGTRVTLRSMNQGSVYFRHSFETGVQATFWIGLVDEHGESNAAFGAAPPAYNSIVIGADFVAPLNDSFALYGETNLVTPADTGTVDAYFGIVWYPYGNAKVAHLSAYSPLLSTAAPTSFSVDLLPE